jgi:hypothetical protein
MKEDWIMKRFLCVVLLGLLILGSASAGTMNEYTLSPFAFDTQAMLNLTFGEQAANAQPDDREYLFYTLPDSTSASFCGQNDTFGFGQMRLTVFTPLVLTEQYEPYISENIEPSGIAKCALTAEEARAKAEAWLAELGITDTYLQSMTAYGRVSKLPAGYLVAFGQMLNGMPVYWAASTQFENAMIYQSSAQSNRIEVVLSDSGLIKISGYWSTFTPTRQGVSVISEQEAVAAFAAVGEQASSVELCYLLTGTKDAAKATPAYRYQNRFISALDGKVLQ